SPTVPRATNRRSNPLTGRVTSPRACSTVRGTTPRRSAAPPNEPADSREKGGPTADGTATGATGETKVNADDRGSVALGSRTGKTLPDSRGAARPRNGPGACGRRYRLRPPSWRDARTRRRVGLWEVHRRTDAAPSRSTDCGHGDVRWGEYR